jgi:hypothetical protein
MSPASASAYTQKQQEYVRHVWTRHTLCTAQGTRESSTRCHSSLHAGQL